MLHVCCYFYFILPLQEDINNDCFVKGNHMTLWIQTGSRQSGQRSHAIPLIIDLQYDLFVFFYPFFAKNGLLEYPPFFIKCTILSLIIQLLLADNTETLRVN